MGDDILAAFIDVAADYIHALLVSSYGFNHRACRNG